ncbi:Scr1 family TA system antitoxin-like transcriptional regulator [Streptomyces sp. NPDC089173]|uniref:Scr1 family TA system antitoxin-like transcriptional regulator n=1 Tax=Streptomyces sp. NPDC089173 TaxID=3154965 RepID=UPI00344FBAB2
MADEDVSEPDLDLDIDPADDSSAVMAAVGRQIKLWRETAGLRAAELGTAIGYSEDLVYKVEGGRRIPKPEFLDGTDRAVGAGGKISAMKQDVAEARYPKKVKDLAKLEREAVELGAYGNHNVHGLLQTAEYARALYEMRRPAFGPDEVERYVAARMDRQEIFRRKPLAMLTFVQEEVTIRRPLGGRAVRMLFVAETQTPAAPFGTLSTWTITQGSRRTTSPSTSRTGTTRSSRSPRRTRSPRCGSIRTSWSGGRCSGWPLRRAESGRGGGCSGSSTPGFRRWPATS